MFERDYLMKLLADLIQALVRSMNVALKEENPYAAARALETAIGNAVDMDASIFLSLSPESMQSMLAISSIDQNAAGYIARSLALASAYSKAAGEDELADFRMKQARAVSDAYECDLTEEDFASDVTIEEATEAMQQFLESDSKL